MAASRSVFRLSSSSLRGILFLRQVNSHAVIKTASRQFHGYAKTKVNSSRLLGIVGIFGGVGVGTLFAFKEQHASEFTNNVEDDKQQLPSRSKVPSITLYQYQTCPFCCKVRAFLEYYGLEYSIVEVNPLTRKEIKFSHYKKVPITVVNGVQINDSSVITSVLRSYLLGEQSLETLLTYYPEMKSTNDDGKEVIEYANRHAVMHVTGVDKNKQKELMEERQWRKWVDNTFVHTLSPNIYRTAAEANQAFEYFSTVGNFSTVERYAVRYCGSVVMYVLGKHLKQKYRLKDDVRQSLYEEAEKWMKAVGKRKFLGGSSPNLADLAMYGVLSGLEDLDMFKDLMANTSIKPWYYRVKKAITNHEGSQTIDENALKG
ncbi:prostaglandin E synthase 2-like [Actinia tenebrosa]|uniref:Prostaglandin E synthase 2 n=1 Tax=Actinia tenebrosa TaxID=6105 RepID=A0A6P8IFG1_ACTTE|nr:prostaglandin E synthase 2-like [Actinia tenebrosa]